jgi:hypothetical protein
MNIKDRDEMTNIVRDVWFEFNKLKPEVEWRIDIDNSRFKHIHITFTDNVRKRESEQKYKKSKWGKPKYNPNSYGEDTWDEDFDAFCERSKEYYFTYNFNLELSTKLNIMGLKEFLQTHDLYRTK